MATAHLTKVLRHAERRLLAEAQRKPTDTLDLYRRFTKVEEHRLKLAHGQGAGGRELCRQRADLISVVLQHIWAGAIEHVTLAHGPDVATEIVLIAVGGCGRGELNPYSDVDIHFLYTKGRKTEHRVVQDVVEQVLYMLWDVGFKVGHAARTLDELVDQANRDLLTKTALLESRYVCGDKDLWAQFERSFERLCIDGRENEYLQWRLEDQDDRHAKNGGTVFVQEPNVKNGCGGLRDYHNLMWVARVKKGLRTTGELLEAKLLHATERKQIDQAYDFLLRLRTQMHLLYGRGNDQLTLQLQGRVANAFRYPQPNILRRTEALMRDYYLHAHQLYLICNTLSRRLIGQGEHSRPRWSYLPARSSSARRIEGFVLLEGEFEVDDINRLSEDPLSILRVFLLAQQHNAVIGPQLALRLRRRASLVTRQYLDRPEVQEMLITILSRKGCVGRILRSMHELGLLGRFFPEFAPLTCLVQHEFFHRYTADEHTLVCLEMLDRILDADTPPFSKYSSLLHKVERPYVLYLAMLLHDTGKAANSKQHSDESAANAVKVARRLRLPKEDLPTLVFLVDHHLTMSETARRKNLEDDEAIMEFARLVQTSPRLDLLMLLTFADSEGTSASHAWSDWKELLLWQLYRRTTNALTGAREFLLAAQRSLEELQEATVLALAKEIGAEEVLSHFAQLPPRYFVSIPEELMQHHIRVVHNFFYLQVMQGDTALKPVTEWRDFPQLGYSEVTLVTWDRERVFAKICGAFAAVGLSILNADIYTRNDSIVLDTFRVSSLQTGGLMHAQDKKVFREMIERALTDSTFDFGELFKNPSYRNGFEEEDFPTRITFDQRSSSDYTLLDVQTPDRPGLLYHVANALAELNVDIGYARITTEKGAALDTFYITDADGKKIASPDWTNRIIKKVSDALSV